jgi:transposase
LEDFVPAGHPARLVRELVDAMDLAELGFSVRTSVDGRPNYAMDLLLKVWLFGYLNGIRKLRKLERACRENLSLVWLTGMNYPDHNTLWRFFRDNRKAIRAVYKRVLRFAVEQQLVEVVLHAIDGTKILAQGSTDAIRSKEKLAEVLGQLDQAVEEVMEQMERSAQEGGAEYELPENWRDDARRREQIRELLGRMEVEECNKIHPQEPDARLMKTRGHGVALGYNAQAVADAGSGLIVAADVVNDQNDFRQLVRMMEQVEENVGGCAEQTLGDGGYASAAELDRAEQRQYEVLVNERFPKDEHDPEGKYHASKFMHDEQRDCLVCPQGKELKFERMQSKGESGEVVRLYRGKECGSCPVRSECSKDPRGRSVGLGRFHGALQRQRQKRALEENQPLLKRRKGIIEHVFGYIKEVLQLRRFDVSRLDGVRTQWALICTAYNIMKLLPMWRTGRLILRAA